MYIFRINFKKITIKIENPIFQINYARYEKISDYKIACLNEVYKFSSIYYLIRCRFFHLIQKSKVLYFSLWEEERDYFFTIDFW